MLSCYVGKELTETPLSESSRPDVLNVTRDDNNLQQTMIIYIYIHTYTCICIYVCVLIYIYIYIYIYTHTHAVTVNLYII